MGSTLTPEQRQRVEWFADTVIARRRAQLIKEVDIDIHLYTEFGRCLALTDKAEMVTGLIATFESVPDDDREKLLDDYVMHFKDPRRFEADAEEFNRLLESLKIHIKAEDANKPDPAKAALEKEPPNMTWAQYAEFVEAKKRVGAAINPDLAEVESWFTDTLDPYGVLGIDSGSAGREWFVRAPGSDEWVLRGHLPPGAWDRIAGRPHKTD
jgi:hypothetical protein